MKYNALNIKVVVFFYFNCSKHEFLYLYTRFDGCNHNGTIVQSTDQSMSITLRSYYYTNKTRFRLEWMYEPSQ